MEQQPTAYIVGGNPRMGPAEIVMADNEHGARVIAHSSCFINHGLGLYDYTVIPLKTSPNGNILGHKENLIKMRDHYMCLEGEDSCGTCSKYPMGLEEYEVCENCHQCNECGHQCRDEKDVAESSIGQ